MVPITKETAKHPLIEIFDRIERAWIEHEGTHKIIVEGITLETSDKSKNVTKVIRLSGDLNVDVSKK